MISPPRFAPTPSSPITLFESIPMRVQVCTWNAGQTLQSLVKPDFAGWLAPEASDAEDVPPAIYAIGFQETVPLPFALTGTGDARLDQYERILREEVETHARAAYQDHKDVSYNLVKRDTMGGIALFVYATREVLADVGDIQAAAVGCGPMFMSNKGAIGIRFKLQSDGTYWTFVSAHLAAHDYNVAQRNLDWQAIVSQMVFRESTNRQVQIYDTHYLFVFGDLNYRLNVKEPTVLSLGELGKHIDAGTHSSLLHHDQLKQEISKRETMHALSEAAIEFQPSYKYVVGTDRYKAFSKRVPSWCDRILFASAQNSIKAESYQSIMKVKLSDHKPVKALYRISTTKRASLTDKAGTLAYACPYPIDSWYLLKRTLGTTIDRTVGCLWLILHFLGLGNAKYGLILLTVSFLYGLFGNALGRSLSSVLDYWPYSNHIKQT